MLVLALLTTLASAADFHTVSGYATLSGNSVTSTNVLRLSDGRVRPSFVATATAYAPIQLPHGARITHLRCTMRDQDTAGTITVSLRRNGLGQTGSEDVIALVATTVADSDPLAVSPFAPADPAFERVDNINFSYHVRVMFVGHVNQGNVDFRGCVVRTQ